MVRGLVKTKKVKRKITMDRLKNWYTFVNDTMSTRCIYIFFWHPGQLKLRRSPLFALVSFRSYLSFSFIMNNRSYRACTMLVTDFEFKLQVINFPLDVGSSACEFFKQCLSTSIIPPFCNLFTLIVWLYTSSIIFNNFGYHINYELLWSRLVIYYIAGSYIFDLHYCVLYVQLFTVYGF